MYKLVDGLQWSTRLPKRILRRVGYEMHGWQIRWMDWQLASSWNWADPIEISPPWGNDSARPGFLLNELGEHDCIDNTNAVYAHQFNVLSNQCKKIIAQDDARKAMVSAWAYELPMQVVQQYVPIEWHTDIHSGYRWDPALFYRKIRVAPISGADIKIPRELSRFQHIGALAQGPLVRGGQEFLLQVLDWIAANPVRRGVNWACTMDVALRVINWIWGLRFFEAEVIKYPNALRVITRAVHQHGYHIEHNLEYSAACTANHYLSDIAGLLYIGAAFPQFHESDRWLLFALQQLNAEIGREVYSDGGVHEGSTHYHRLVAELFVSCATLAERIPASRRARLLDVDIKKHKVRPALQHINECSLNFSTEGAILPQSYYDRLAKMAEFTAGLTKPNGLVPQFGDNDSGRVHVLFPCNGDDIRNHAHVIATVGELLGRADLQTMGISACTEAKMIAGGLSHMIKAPKPIYSRKNTETLFQNSGIAVVKRGLAWLAVTCGPNGQGGHGGHNHNDKLSFELNINGHDVIVDGGCPAYTAMPEVRNRYRSTWAHSTLAVVGREQDRLPSGMKGLFQLPEKSNPKLKINEQGLVVGSHDGYGKRHQRTFCLTEHSLVIHDTLMLADERWLIFNVDPAVAICDVMECDHIVRCNMKHRSGCIVRIEVVGGDEAVIGEGCFSVGYGNPIPTQNLKIRMIGSTIQTTMEWFM